MQVEEHFLCLNFTKCQFQVLYNNQRASSEIIAPKATAILYIKSALFLQGQIFADFKIGLIRGVLKLLSANLYIYVL